MDPITQFDGNFLIGIQHALNADWLTPVMKVITAFGEVGNFAIFVCLVLLLFRETRRLGFICTLSLLFTFICCNLVIKPLVGRPRPWELFEAVHNYLPHPGDASFPSGHTANTMGPAWAMFMATMPQKVGNDDRGKTIRSYDAVTCLGWKGEGAGPEMMHILSVMFIVIALMVGLSRLYLGMHFPTDVLCALLLGMTCATIVLTLFERAEKKYGVFGSGSKKQESKNE